MLLLFYHSFFVHSSNIYIFNFCNCYNIARPYYLYKLYILYIYTKKRITKKERDFISLKRKCIRKDLLTNIFTKVKVVLIPENISVIVVYLKIFMYLCSVESNQIINGCSKQIVLSLLLYKLSLSSKPTKKLLI